MVAGMAMAVGTGSAGLRARLRGWPYYGGYHAGPYCADEGNCVTSDETPPFAISGRPRAEARRRCQSAFRRHVIDDQHADHDTDQQRRQKKIFHFVDPFTLQSRTAHPTENFVRSGVRPSFAERQLTFHGGCSIDRVRAGTIIPPSCMERPGRARPFAIRGWNRVGRRPYFVVVADVSGVPGDWRASAGRFAQAEKPNAAAHATMRTIRI